MNHTITISLSSSDAEHLEQMRKSLNGDQQDFVQLQSSNLETPLGVVDTIAVLTAVITFAAGVSSNVLASWIYDRFVKGKTKEDKVESISINGIKLDQTNKSVHLEIEKIIITKIKPE